METNHGRADGTVNEINENNDSNAFNKDNSNTISKENNKTTTTNEENGGLIGLIQQRGFLARFGTPALWLVLL